MNDLLSTIEKWKIEAFSPHNDGWTQNGYRKNLIELRDYLNKIGGLKLHEGGRNV